MPVDDATRIRRNAEILSAGVADETILLDPSDWMYVGFNETATRIWAVLDQPRSVGEIIRVLLRDYDVDRTTCEAQVTRFVEEMSGRGLLILEPAA